MEKSVSPYSLGFQSEWHMEELALLGHYLMWVEVSALSGFSVLAKIYGLNVSTYFTDSCACRLCELQFSYKRQD
jgi:hypothetical protein